MLALKSGFPRYPGTHKNYWNLFQDLEHPVTLKFAQKVPH